MSPTYLSLGAFYASDPARDISREQDVGLYWRGAGAQAPTFRAAWVQDTGELYVMQHEGTLGGGRVHVLATYEDRTSMELALDGWREACGEHGSLRWLLEHVPDAPDHLRRVAGMTAATTPAPAGDDDRRPYAFGFGGAA